MSPRSKRAEAGFTSIEWMMAVGFSLIVLVTLVNLIAVQYGRGVIRAAADEGARSGARFAAADGAAQASQDVQIAACLAREQNVLDNLGRMAEDVTPTCEVAGTQMQATVTATFTGWVPGVPDFNLKATAVANREDSPNQ